MAQALPERIGPYRVKSLLGKGGMATVFLVHDEEGRSFALKRLDVAEKEGRVRFRREAEILRQVDHPNVVKVHAAESEPPYYVMELLSGKCLEAWIAEGRVFLEDEVRRLLVELAGALQAIHELGVIHRDLKPHNLMLEEGGRLVLSDFGIARDTASTDITQTGSFVGTPLYLAPEQIRNHHVDGRCDLYQAGLIAYKLLTGLVPFEKEDILVLTMKRVTEPAPPISTVVPTVSPGFERIVARLLAVDPDERHPDAQALLRDLEAVGAGEMPERPLPMTRPRKATLPRSAAAPHARGDAKGSAIPRQTLGAIALGCFLGLVVLGGMWWGFDTGGPGRGELLPRTVLITGRERRVTFRFRTDRPMRTSIEYGSDGRLDRILHVSPEPRRDHEGVAEGVDPARLLRYRLVGTDEAGRRHVGELREMSLLMGTVFPMSSVDFERVGRELRVAFRTERPCKSWICLGREGKLGKAIPLAPSATRLHEGDVPLPEGRGPLSYRFVFLPEGGMRLTSMTHSLELED